MIARIELKDGRAAELGDDMSWSSGDEELTKILNVLHSPTRDLRGVSPADGLPGSLQVLEAARRFGAEVVWVESETTACMDEGSQITKDEKKPIVTDLRNKYKRSS